MLLLVMGLNEKATGGLITAGLMVSGDGCAAASSNDPCATLSVLAGCDLWSKWRGDGMCVCAE